MCQRYSTALCEWSCGSDGFTVAGTDFELWKVQVKMREWFDVKVLWAMGSARNDKQDIEMLGRTLISTDDGLEYEAVDKHWQALRRGLGLIEQRTTVSSAAVKTSDIDAREDEELLETGRAPKFRSWEFGSDTKPHGHGQVRCAMRGEGGMLQDGQGPRK